MQPVAIISALGITHTRCKYPYKQANINLFEHLIQLRLLILNCLSKYEVNKIKLVTNFSILKDQIIKWAFYLAKSFGWNVFVPIIVDYNGKQYSSLLTGSVTGVVFAKAR
jgi:hypothetical protein